MFATIAAAQAIEFGPSPIYAGQDVAFRAAVGVCPEMFVVTGTAVAVGVVTVRYELLRPAGGGCFSGSPPLPSTHVLGSFPTGSYELRLEGTRDGVALPTIAAPFEVLPIPPYPPFAHIEFVDVDRRIVIGASPTLDVVVRATDATGAPVAGANVFASLAWFFGLPLRVDAFGFSGFGPSALQYVPPLPDPIDPTWTAITDATGAARITAPLLPGGVVVVAGAWPGPGRATVAFANVVALEDPPTGAPVAAVEYHHAALGRYILAVNDDEIAALDRGAFAGWERSPGAVAVWPTRASAPDHAIPVCRFFSPVHTSHFYTVDPAECDALEARWPGTWILEKRDAFYVLTPLPSRVPECPAFTQPLYRMYRASPGPSHRYMTGTRLRDAMVAAGWVQEGLSGDRSAMCVPH